MIWLKIPILLPQSRMERVQRLVEEKKKGGFDATKMAENVRRAYFLKISPGATPTCLGITPPRLVQMSYLWLVTVVWGDATLSPRCCCGLFRVGLLCLGHVMFSALLHQTK